MGIDRYLISVAKNVLAWREAEAAIAFGYPGAELREAAERGGVRLGGCVMTGDDP